MLPSISRWQDVSYISGSAFSFLGSDSAKNDFRRQLKHIHALQSFSAQVKPLLEAMGQGILDCGDDVRAGNAMKLVGNFFIVSFVELLAEGMALGEKNGVQRQWVLDFITRLFPGHITKGVPHLQPEKLI